MDINKRSILWIVFAVSLVILWNNWMVSTGKPSMFAPAPAKPAVASASATAAGGVPAAVAAASAAAAATAPAGDAAAPAPIKTEVVTITTDVMRVDINTLGGVIQRLELLKHNDGTEEKKNQLLFRQGGKHTYLGETGLVGAPNLPTHLTPFVAQPGARMLNDGDKVQLVLEAEQGGVKLVKTFTFKKGDYVVDVQHAVTNTSAAPLSPQLYLQLKHDGWEPDGSSWLNPKFIAPTIYTPETKYQKYEFKHIEKDAKWMAENPGKPSPAEHAKKSNDGWFAITEHFFVSAFVPQEKLARDIFTKRESENIYTVGVVQPLGAVAPGATITNNAKLYAGPQDTETLEKVAEGLDLVKDYGMLAVVARPMWWAMDQIHDVVGNWGWTIIAFTVLIKLLFFPLSAASFRSMAKMKLVTPKMTAIRERHKGDPQKMNQAMMELYKTEKINPLGGCLPILVQMPVFIALYWVLNASVEMRGAPWALWIHDLTKPDPYFVLPVLYAISMYITTRLNPQPADPMQAKMMMFMPIAFSVMFFFFPSGLVLYWVVNNLLSIAQQWVITKKFETGEAK
ncbi:membrane protein insertase YidC [Pseudoduganella sp. DS3]|uniref:Membrane protein insertase YidC n=1 Tax=Pseudoduganella guangdongensis TaxID=2692179 RepID=A0A6N9HNE7_9BURK|nr:membrane protein insertase YidC [Pseudoduganella guangdongensis]MYN04235.1 membrane protein insertase YidC [Pseudoduganella guangdongensis]